MGGTIYFDVKEFKPYCKREIHFENDKYKIYNVNPCHSGHVKRYSVYVILKKHFSNNQIKDISLEIKEQVKQIEVYSNSREEARLKGLSTNIVWIYFGLDEEDMIRNRYMLKTTWVDSSQDKKSWYRTNNENNFVIDNVHFEVFTGYNLLRCYEKENTAEKNDIVSQVKEIECILISNAEKFIRLYNEYKNKEFNEKEFINKTIGIRRQINKYYLLSADLNFAPKEIEQWINVCYELFGIIHNFIVFYNKSEMNIREEKDRNIFLNLEIKNYYKCLNKIKKIEQQLDL